MKNLNFTCILLCFLFTVKWFTASSEAQTLNENPALDEKVKKFLDSHTGQWHDMNVPQADGQILYDIIVKNNYKCTRDRNIYRPFRDMDILGIKQNRGKAYYNRN